MNDVILAIDTFFQDNSFEDGLPHLYKGTDSTLGLGDILKNPANESGLRQIFQT